MKRTPRQTIRFCRSESELRFAEILANGLPSHGLARLDARNAVMMHGVSLTLVCRLISDAIHKSVTIKQVTSALRRRGVPFIKVDFDDPLIEKPGAGDFERMNRPGLLGKALDYFELLKHCPELLHGAVDGDVFMPPYGMEILEGIAAYAAVKQDRNWNFWKRSHNK